jgi:hypothetical protein
VRRGRAPRPAGKRRGVESEPRYNAGRMHRCQSPPWLISVVAHIPPMVQGDHDTVVHFNTLPLRRPARDEVFERGDVCVTAVVAGVDDERFGLGQVLTGQRWVAGGIETSAEQVEIS